MDCIFADWEEGPSTLLVLPTGCGKTQVFASVIHRSLPKRALVLAHREELVFQARDRIDKIAGITCQIEMAGERASTTLWDRSPCVIASVQSLTNRLAQFPPEDFGVLIIDEAHHCTAPTYRKIIDHFSKNPALKILGVTATPDRTDEEALGQIFAKVAFDYEILNAISDGWLVPVEQQMVTMGELDFSKVRLTAGDLNAGDLAAIMEAEKNVQGLVSVSLQIIGAKSSILFASSVLHARMACEIFNRHKDGMAAFIEADTDKEERRKILKRFQDGTTQVLCNVGIATEGFDAPVATIVLNGRPTKSRALYAQCAGRVLRPLPGLVDGLATPEERRAAIANSAKPSALLVDFVGNSGRHKLMSSLDILGGNASDEAIEVAAKAIKAGGGPVRVAEFLVQTEEKLAAKEKERLEREARRLAEEAKRTKVVASVPFTARAVSPFEVFDLTPVRERGWDQGKTLSEKQSALLVKQGINPSTMPYAQSKALLNEMFRRWGGKLCTFKQAKLLKSYGYQTKNMTMADASTKITTLKANGWKRPPEEAA